MGHLPTWEAHVLLSYLFAFSYCSWSSSSKNTGVVCHSLLQWTRFCQNSSLWLLWPSHLRWPYMKWLIASLSYINPFAMTRLWSMKWRNLGGLTKYRFIYSYPMRVCIINYYYSELLWLINFHISLSLTFGLLKIFFLKVLIHFSASVSREPWWE